MRQKKLSFSVDSTVRKYVFCSSDLKFKTISVENNKQQLEEKC